MKEQEKLGLQIAVGGFLLIIGTYGLFKLFGDSRLIALIAIAGWVVLMGYIVKFMNTKQ